GRRIDVFMFNGRYDQKAKLVADKFGRGKHVIQMNLEPRNAGLQPVQGGLARRVKLRGFGELRPARVEVRQTWGFFLRLQRAGGRREEQDQRELNGVGMSFHILQREW